MISTVLQRLETSGGRAIALDRPQRWYASSELDSRTPGADVGRASRIQGAPTSSGRIRTPAVLEAERVDDGVLVTAPAGLHGERIVWIGDVELEVADGMRAPGVPRFHVDGAGASVEVVWALTAEIVRVRLTLPFRPVGGLTFENDELDPRVEMLPSPSGAIARVRPYRGLPALRIAFDGDLRFEADPCWRRGVDVFDATGAHHVEDRFSPGVFTVRRSAASRTLRLVAQVDAVDHVGSATVPGPTVAGGDATVASTLSEVLALPGFVVSGDVRGADAAAWFEASIDDMCRDSERWTHDGVLWLARTALLLEHALDGGSSAVCGDVLARDVLSSGVVQIADAVLERAAAADGDPAAAFRGCRRWYDVLGPMPEPDDRPAVGAVGGAVGVETAALLHQLFVHTARLTGRSGDAVRAAHARRAALHTRRWFQRSFWLPTPKRLADVEIDRVKPGDSRPLALRPHMLLAASFEGAPLDLAQRRAVVQAADGHLVTALGVRSLAAEDDLHDPRSMVDGAIWPWLLGPHVEASLRAFGHERGRSRAHRVLIDALQGAPQAWAEHDGHSLPLGSLDFPPATGEAARARAMLDTNTPVGSGL